MGETRNFRCKRRDCVYRSNNSIYGCDYSSITGQLRVAGLPRELWAPELCDKYISGKRKYTRKNIPAMPLDEETVMGLYKDGLSDTAIGRKLNVSGRRVTDWRLSHKLPRNGSGPRVLTVDNVRVLELYQEGLSDGAIARKTGFSTAAVRDWRINANLPSNEYKGNIDKKRAELFYNDGKSDVEIANLLECSVDAIRTWRKRTNRDPNARYRGVMRIGPQMRERMKRLHIRGLLQAEQAVVLGLHPISIQRHMAAMAIPPNIWTRDRRIEGVEKVEDGFTWDEETQMFWVFVKGKLRAAARTQDEAAKLYEEVRK